MGTLPAETRAKLQRCSVANITTILVGRGFTNIVLVGLAPVDPAGPRMVGEAFTMRMIPNRKDKAGFGPIGNHGATMQRAMETCPESGVLVIDARGDVRASSAGDIFVRRLKVRGVAGIVSDGGFRDIEGISGIGLPAFHRQPAPTPSLTVHCAGDLDVPIACAGVAIYPGDVLVGDRDGVVVIPAELADEVAEEVVAKMEYEEFVDEEVARGTSLEGMYPPNDAFKQRYETWRKNRSGN